MPGTVDILSKAPYPVCDLSNFAAHRFVLDGMEIGSMEGFLQSLKFRSRKRQVKVRLLSGKAAKKAGHFTWRWRLLKRLYYGGKRVDRFGAEYAELITRAYDAMAESNPQFVANLLSLRGCTLAHSIGKSDKRETVLTVEEFLGQLYRLQRKYAAETAKADTAPDVS